MKILALIIPYLAGQSHALQIESESQTCAASNLMSLTKGALKAEKCINNIFFKNEVVPADWDPDWTLLEPIWNRGLDPVLRTINEIPKETVRFLYTGKAFPDEKQYPYRLKGKDYIELSGQQKVDRIWADVLHDTTPSVWHVDELEIESNSPAYDEDGDQFECKSKLQGCHHKTVHGVGSVGKAEWISTGDHPYTGAFKGCTTGIHRIGSAMPVLPHMKQMWPSIGFKCLRDGIDSGNVLVLVDSSGQHSLNFFENDMGNHTGPQNGNIGPRVEKIALRTKLHTNYLASTGVSEFAEAQQDGTIEEDVVFPFDIQFRPTGELSTPSDTYDQPLEEYFKTIPSGTKLYDIYATDKPVELGGVEQKIGELKTTSIISSSMFGDEKLLFRHVIYDDDLVYYPEWEPYVPNLKFFPATTQLIADLVTGQNGCPFAYLFNWIGK